MTSRRGHAALLAIPLTLLLAACAAISAEGQGQATESSAVQATPSPPTSGEPEPIPASNPQALPDPLGSIEYEAGDVVELPGVSVEYRGLSAEGDQLVARFHVTGSVPGEAEVLLPDGSVVHAHLEGDLLVSEPLGEAASPPAKDDTIHLHIGRYLVPFLAGAVR
jgi:hypothetical protein